MDEAYSLYQQAWTLKHTYDIAGNLGQVELKLGKFRDAAEHLDFTLRLFPPTGKAAPREAIRLAFEAARKEVAALTIRVSAQGAAVSVDGTAIGLSPFEVPVFVDPGKRTLEATRQRGGRIVAAGTTTLRALESAAISGRLVAGASETQLFITPGFQFNVVDRLITNFHLPKSTLLMLVSAFAGYEAVRAIYRHGIAERYQFFSYGDAMLLQRR